MLFNTNAAVLFLRSQGSPKQQPTLRKIPTFSNVILKLSGNSKHDSYMLLNRIKGVYTLTNTNIIMIKILDKSFLLYCSLKSQNCVEKPFIFIQPN